MVGGGATTAPSSHPVFSNHNQYFLQFNNSHLKIHTGFEPFSSKDFNKIRAVK